MLTQQLIVGSVYRVKFKGIFERHGFCTTPGLKCLHAGNGVFKLDGISTFRALMTKGVKLYDIFFKPLGITEEEYQQYYDGKPGSEFEPEYDVKTVDKVETIPVIDETQSKMVNRTVTTTKEIYVETGKSVLTRYAADSVNYGNFPIYTFIDVVDPDDVIYAPALTIDQFPEIEISEYKNLTLCFHLGYFDKPYLLDPMLLAIRERLTAYGVQPKRIKLYSTGSKWLNPEEYKAIQQVRLPAENLFVAKDALFNDFKDRRVITPSGVVKDVVQTLSNIPETAAHQVAFDTLRAREIVVGKGLFMTDVTVNDTFNGVSEYYEVVDDNGREALVPIEVKPAGDPVMQIVPLDGDEPSGCQKYKEVVDYQRVPYNVKRSGYEHLYKKVVTTEDDSEPVESFEEVVKDSADWNDKYLVLYTQTSKFVVAESGGTHYSKPRVTGGTGVYKYENYASKRALELVGDKFDYTDIHGSAKYISNLTLADIIDFSSVILFSDVKLLPSNYSRYAGLYFRVIGADNVAKYYLINEDFGATLGVNGMFGDIIGSKGDLSRETSFLDENIVDRNYYIRYQTTKSELEACQARCAALEAKLKALLPS